MDDVFKTIVKKRFEPRGFSISPVKGTKHWNVLRLYDPSDKKWYIAKGILHIEGNTEMGPEQMNVSYTTEKNILSSLPEWWGLSLKESFKEDPFRVIVTPEIPNCKWSTYKGNDAMIASKLFKQIEWLHKHKIAHNDLELKNILLTCDNQNAVVIDFEKATQNSSNTSMRNDTKHLIDSLNENETTKGIARKLKTLAFGKLPLTRRHSLGGKRRRTYKL